MSSNEHPPHTARGGGSIIAFEGIDGCGKTTIALRLVADLQALRWSVRLTRRPSDGPVGCSPGAREVTALALPWGLGLVKPCLCPVVAALREPSDLVATGRVSR